MAHAVLATTAVLSQCVMEIDMACSFLKQMILAVPSTQAELPQVMSKEEYDNCVRVLAGSCRMQEVLSGLLGSIAARLALPAA